MDVSLNNIMSLQDNKSYYLSDDNKIKESGFLDKVCCFFNIGKARQRVNNLMQAVKTTLEQSAGLSNNSQLKTELQNINTKYGFKGSLIKTISENFNTSNKSYVLSNKVSNKAASLLPDLIAKMSEESGGKIKNTPELRDFLLLSVKSLAKDNIAKLENGQLTEESNQRISNRLNEMSDNLVSLTKNENLGKPEVDGFYCSYIREKIFTSMGKEIGNFEDLKSPEDAFKQNAMERLRNPDEKLLNSNLKPSMEYVLEQAKAHPELKDLLLKNGVNILINTGLQMRTLDSVKERVDSMVAAEKELSQFKETDKKLYDYGLNCIKAMGGAKIPEGMLSGIINQAKNFDISSLLALNNKSSVLEIYQAMSKLFSGSIDLKKELNEIVGKGNPDNLKGFLEGPDERIAVKDMFYKCVLSRLNAAQRMNVMNAFESMENSKLLTFLVEAKPKDVAEINGYDKTNYSRYVSELSMEFEFIKGSLHTTMGTNSKPLTFHYQSITKLDSTFRTLAEQIIEESNKAYS